MAAEKKSNPIPAILFIVLLFFVITRFFSGGMFLPTPDIKISPGEEAVLADLQTLSGTSKSLEEWQGKVLVVNFWATWCPPCVAELPNLVSLKGLTVGKNVEVICVSSEKPEEIESFVQSKGYPPEMFLRSPADSRKWTGNGIPNTLILGPEGKVLDSHLGAAAWDDDQVVNQLVELANASES